MSRVTQIIAGVDKARLALQDLVISLPVTSYSEGVYDPTTSTVTKIPTTVNVEAVPIDWDENEIDGNLIRRSDIKMVVFSEEIELDTTDIVEYNDSRYKIHHIEPIRAGTRVPVRIIQLRA
jgi:hypothetical protein